MVTSFRGLLFALAGLTQLVTAAPAQTLEPGRWRVITNSVSMPDTPPKIATRCLTPEDVADLGKTFGPQFATQNATCERTAFKLDGAGLSWRLQCRGDVDMEVAGQFIFDSPTRYSALITSKGSMLDRIVHETMVSISAERIGECR